MSSSEDYLDSLLDSILGGGKSGEDEKPASEEMETAETASTENTAADTGKAMSPEEIEEMLVSMGTLEGGQDEPEEQESEVDDMEAMLAFMNEHNASVAEEAQADSFSLDELELGEGELSYGSVDDLASEGSGMDEMATDDLTDLNMDEISLDSLDLGEEELPDEGLDAFSLDSLSLEEPEMEEGASDGMSDFNLDDLSLDDFSFGEEDPLQAETMTDESVQDSMSDFNLDGLSLDDLDLGEDSSPETDMVEESASDGMSDFSLDDFSLDDLSSEEPEPETGGEDLMSMEEIDRLLGGDMSFEEESSASDELALEENGEGDDDLSALLADMEQDEDLSEIHNLLGESEQGVSTDDDMLAMLESVGGDDGAGFGLFRNDEAARGAESIRELTPEEAADGEGEESGKKKKKRKKLFGRKKNKGGDDEQQAEELGTDLADLLGEVSAPEPDKENAKEKKPGMIARLMDFLLESDEDDDPLAEEVLAGSGGAIGNISGENRELLNELSEEDKKGKKGKKDKKKKKEKEPKKEKEKKPKKEKKQKPKKEKSPDSDVDLFAPPEKRLSKKKVITVFLFCGTIAACIILATSILPNYVQEQAARLAYDQKEYGDVYDLLYGKELKEEDEILFQRSELILQMDRKLSSYDNYVNLDMRLEALDALVSGVARYQLILADAEAYNVVGEVTDIYVQILGRLSSDFGVSEADALDIIGSKDNVVYSQRLTAIINGTYSSEAEVEESGERQDVLPEEEEIIERVDGLEEETPDVLPEEEMQDDQSGDDIQDIQPEAEENSDEGPEE